MKPTDIEIGGLYRNKNNVRQVIKMQGGNITYKCVAGRTPGYVKVCWITTMCGWAKERISERDL